MRREKYQEAEMKVIKFQLEDVVVTSNGSEDDGPIELPYVPRK